MELDIAYESDRGCIIVAAALIDQVLEEAIRTHIRKFLVSKSVEKSLFDMSGPISNFSSKILICRSFGIIDQITYEDLMILRKLRNSFAHGTEEASFTAEATKQKIRSMHFVKKAMAEHNIKRYDIAGEKKVLGTKERAIQQWELQAKGYLLYDKSMFCIAVKDIHIHILKLQLENFANTIKSTLHEEAMKNINTQP
ncbi:MltR family transcriptional regulator [Pseudomonas resinovorans]|uniref:MltR family transcriptional regulator n=1 Tax=Metapseudomonas resinovorans TaxID=53412 RepID=A0ABT4Y227_METRE|nr:MltR family transcriptional regulator [Pseudomonas resinovorans]MDA8482888.1 MltR family transcriptional regulator [Pseudomonas resinovorans]